MSIACRLLIQRLIGMQNVLANESFKNQTATHLSCTKYIEKFSPSQLLILTDLFNHEGLALYLCGLALSLVPPDKMETFHSRIIKIEMKENTKSSKRLKIS